MFHATTCPPENRLLAWAEGSILPSETETIESHLNHCRTCQAILDEGDSHDPLIRLLHPVPFRTRTKPASDATLQELKRRAKRLKPVPPAAAPVDNDSGQQPSLATIDECESTDDGLDFLAPPTEPGTLGRIGRYNVQSVLGSGGMGIVLRAHDPDLNRPVAVKVLKPALATDAAGRQRFLREAHAVGQVQHPNVCPVYEVGEQNGRLFLVLEYVAGGSLSQRLAGTPQPPRQAAALVETLARAIHAAHAQGIIHRDLKPANILMSGARTDESGGPENPAGPISSAGSLPSALCSPPLISDFGLAKSIADDVTQTKSGVILGTPSYMAPEQAGGKTRDIGPAADIYALGAILYELLTGRPPFRGETTFDTIQQVLSDDPVPPRRLQPKVPRDLETICLRCLEKSPANRYATAAALAEDLHRFLAGEPIIARPVGALEQGAKWAKRNPIKAAGFMMLMVAIAAMATSTILVWKANLEANRQKSAAQTHAADAEAERQRLERDFRSACDVVIHLAEDVVVDDSSQPPDPAEKRSEIALRFFSKFLHPDSGDRVARIETAIAYRYMADLYSINGKVEDAERCYLDAVAVLQRLIDEFPTNHVYRQDQAVANVLMGQLLCEAGHQQRAAIAFHHAKFGFVTALEMDRNGRALNNLAWFLSTCPQPEFRDPSQAVELATAAVSENPGNATCWQTLGKAQYRLEDYDAARTALETAIRLRSESRPGGSVPEAGKSLTTLAPDNSRDRFFLAMAYWHLGEKEKAFENYHRGVEYMGKRNQPIEVRYFRAEAAELLGLKDVAPTGQKNNRGSH